MIRDFNGLMGVVLRGGLPTLIFLGALLAGVLALQLTPREEEPQIVVPMVDVLVDAPGLSARQTERQVTIPLEKLLNQIPGVEHLYSSTRAGSVAVTLRFHVGEDRERSLLNTYNKLYSNQDRIPQVVSRWQLKPVEIDDVPILVVALWSTNSERYGDYELGRMAQEFATSLQAIPQTNGVTVTGGRTRTLRILLDPEAMGARRTTPTDIVEALASANRLQEAGDWVVGNEAISLQAGDVLREAGELRQLVVNVIDGAPVFLRDVADIVDGPQEPEAYSWLQAVSGEASSTEHPMVTLAVAKQRGSNAVTVSGQAMATLERLQSDILPPEIRLTVLRDYGETADAKVNELVTSLGFAVLTVVVFIGVFLGWRAALVVGLALPVCYGAALALDLAFGYTINRVTLFALILSLGLLVDDPITGVDNIDRYLRRGEGSLAERVAGAMREIRSPLIMSTVTIVVAFLPLAFITGMMGPYMAPMAFNVPVSVIISTLVAFLVTPFVASRLLRAEAPADAAAPAGHNLYRSLLAPFLDSRSRARTLILVVVLLFVASALLPALRAVPLKLLPYDNKNEVQVLLDMPEGSSLEHTAAALRQLSAAVSRVPEVRWVAAFAGEPSPMDFNGMVRRYYQRLAPHQGELRLVLADKAMREHQSHAVVLRLRALLAPLVADGVSVKVVEVPPGPPVLSTLVAEVYADTLTPSATHQAAARELLRRLALEPHVVEIDSTLEASQPQRRFITDRQKAALSGISTSDVARLLTLANAGEVAGYLQDPDEMLPVPMELRLPRSGRVQEGDFLRLLVRGRAGITATTTEQGLEVAPQPLVALGELGAFESRTVDRTIHRKDLRQVVYVTAELNGRTPAEVIADIHADQQQAGDTRSANTSAPPWESRTFFNNGGGEAWQLPPGTGVSWTGEGELSITLDVFRDMGLGYAFALLAIFGILRVQTQSTALSLIIMSAIPLTVIGIMPGFWLMNQAGERMVAGAPDPVMFTATAMIGMIALAGIVVRNSLILVEFIAQSLAEGESLREAVLQAGAVRMRPVMLTAGTTLLGNLVITLDPVFNGLALAIIFGIVASTLFTLVIVPVVYWLVFSDANAPASAESAS
ncbi:efflux RND transporter permease subunit [Chromatocurvus halotolerans]|uniref:Multidrug efflux pump subunit AcrB n=1 Tax=Chromatocurvus halotolerans TaxID=1132028 RepID=A0A4V2SBL0_9GAMM|nr:efflux RND transporter permease subunit [Chromatocurvus halotolerans]TCO75900.1 multidrug efflux pump subunit AcrB [Chromatocurvus halotolerans]